MPMDNEERSDHAVAGLLAYLASKGEPITDVPVEHYEIADLICDLLHLGDQYSYSYQELLDHALMHYHGECADAEIAE